MAKSKFGHYTPYACCQPDYVAKVDQLRAVSHATGLSLALS